MDVLFKPAHQAVHQHLLLQRGRPAGAYPGRYGTGGAGGLPDFHRFTRYRRLPQQVATHRAAHLPLQRQRYGIPRLLAQLAELPAQGQQSAGQRIALRMPLRADAEQHRQLRPPFRPLAQYLARDLLQLLRLFHADPAALFDDPHRRLLRPDKRQIAANEDHRLAISALRERGQG